MGQAAVDLPDPLQTPSAPAQNNADDLLSQLAGDEIDRLLSTSSDESPEAEAQPGLDSPLAETAQIEQPVAAVAAPVEPVAEVSASPQESVPAEVSVAPVEEGAKHDAALAEEVQRDLDKLLTPGNAASSETSAAPIEAAPTPAEAIATVTAPAEPATDAKATAPTSSNPGPATESTQATVSQVLDAALASSDTTPPGVVGRLLEFVNSPFSYLSDDARESLGKIAIITTVNAIAVLLYVILFRKH